MNRNIIHPKDILHFIYTSQHFGKKQKKECNIWIKYSLTNLNSKPAK